MAKKEFGDDQRGTDIQGRCVVPNDSGGDQVIDDTQRGNVTPNPSSSGPSAMRHPNGIRPDEIPEGGQAYTDTQIRRAPLNPELASVVVWADALDDLEKSRISTENRVRSLIQVKGLEDSKEVQRLSQLAEAIKALEHGATLGLKRAMREHPLGAWVKATKGVGEKQAARLLASIGDPATRTSPAQLWAYCGYHVVPAGGHVNGDTHISSAPGIAPKRRKGEKANWNTTAKMRAYLIAESCIKKMDSPYRKVYDLRRQHTAETHPDWTLGHSHNDALRVTAKAILKDIWKEAVSLAGATESASPNDAPPQPNTAQEEKSA